jgi:hemolysin activation/secretion protein
LRGFGSGRFVDKNSFFASAEIRTRVYSRQIFGVNAEIELAPFLDFGQVFRSSRNSPFNDLHAVGGLGFRGVVRPQVVGFVDVGLGEQGAAVFTGLEYPF